MDNLTRRCPTCDSCISYTTLRSKIGADLRKSLCPTCAHEKTRQTCRSDAHRQLKSKQTKSLWADTFSVFNSVEYREKLSSAQVTAWQDDTIRSIRSTGMCKAWKENYDAHCAAIKRGNTPEVNARRGESIRAACALDPEIGKRRGAIIATYWREDEAYRNACLPNILSPHKGNTSKGERSLVPALAVHGFKHSVRRAGYVLDFYNEVTNTAIEYFGDYWHCHERYHQRFDDQYGGLHPHKRVPYRDIIECDVKKLEDLAQTMTVHVIWESDLKDRSIEEILESFGCVFDKSIDV